MVAALHAQSQPSTRSCAIVPDAKIPRSDTAQEDANEPTGEETIDISASKQDTQETASASTSQLYSLSSESRWRRRENFWL